MSNFYQAFRDHAQTLAPLTALVGPRMYAMKYPQTPTYPAIRVNKISEVDREYSHSGDFGLITSQYQIEVASSEEQAPNGNPLIEVQTVGAILSARSDAGGFSGFTGDLGVSPNELFVGVMILQDLSETYDPDELRVLRQIQIWRVQHCRET